MRALHTAATGMMAQELNVQVISNNIANMRTTGYKRQRAEFQDLLYEHVSRVGTQTSAQGNILPVGIDLGAGVKTVGTPRLMTQGTLAQTGSSLDLAIRGDGFFKILMPDGTYAYTRDGSFQMDAQGRIVTAQGNVVQPGITIPQNATAVDDQRAGPGVGDAARQRPRRAWSGRSSWRCSSTKPACKASATTCSPGNAGLRHAAERHCPTPTAPAICSKGNLEQANVEAVSEISDLIAAQRAYEMNAKVITAADQMLSATSNLMR